MATQKPLVSIGGQQQVLDSADTIPLQALPVMSATVGGAVPTPPNNATTFLRGDGTFAVPAGSGITRTIVSISIATTAGAASVVDYVYFVTGTTTLTLPAAVGNTNLYTIKCVSGVTTVACNGVQTIEGAGTIGIAVSDSVDLISNGTEWKVI